MEKIKSLSQFRDGRQWKKQRSLLLFFSSLIIPLILVLTACSIGGETPGPEPGVTTLIYAQISEDGVDREWLDNFNSEHEGEIQIEVRDYTQMSEGGKQGIDLLMTEIAAGKVPDIIELGTSGETTQFPYRRLAETGLLEDLWPYIENDPSLGRNAVIEAPLKASEVNGGLYTVFDSFWLHTLAGAKAVVGDRVGWTVEDLQEAFDTMPEGAVILETHRDYSMKEHLLSSFLYGFSDLFIDWESGQSSFDCETFRSILELVKRVPDGGTWQQNYISTGARYGEYNLRLKEGEAMLCDLGLGEYYHIQVYDFLFGEASCAGYPVGDGSTGAYIEPVGIKLAMSSTCADKDAAWQYIRRALYPRQVNYDFDGFPVNKRSHIQRKSSAQKMKLGILLGSEFAEFHVPTTKEQCERVEELFDTPRSSILMDKDVLDIVLDTTGAYFAGDKSIDETVQMIDNRVSLYLHEQM